ncbi:NUDIX domain-containing protein [Patescibacteria group bacterium]
MIFKIIKRRFFEKVINYFKSKTERRMMENLRFVSKKKGKKKVAYVIGRFSPAHKGHIRFICWLLTIFDEVIIGLGSCYEVGRLRHPLLAFQREKIILLSLRAKGVDESRVRFVHLQDFKNQEDGWMKWWKHITSIPGIEEVTHFVTGNEGEILKEIRRRGLKTGFDFINPEKEMPKEFAFPYHATDLRNAILENDLRLYEEIAAFGTRALLNVQDVLAALNGNARTFVPGRQAVDLILFNEYRGGDLEVVCGYRKQDKDDFPGCIAIPGGGIDDYENSMDAGVREFGEETGIKPKIIDRAYEPTHVVVEGFNAKMHFVGLFGEDGDDQGGSNGGSSQVSVIKTQMDPAILRRVIKSKSDLERVDLRPVRLVLEEGLAFSQNDMVLAAMKMF